MQSTTLIGYVIHHRIAAGVSALTTVPGGRITSAGRNDPALTGHSVGEVRALKATCTAERPAVSPEL